MHIGGDPTCDSGGARIPGNDLRGLRGGRDVDALNATRVRTEPVLALSKGLRVRVDPDDAGERRGAREEAVVHVKVCHSTDESVAEGTSAVAEEIQSEDYAPVCGVFKGDYAVGNCTGLDGYEDVCRVDLLVVSVDAEFGVGGGGEGGKGERGRGVTGDRGPRFKGILCWVEAS